MDNFCSFLTANPKISKIHLFKELFETVIPEFEMKNSY